MLYTLKCLLLLSCLSLGSVNCANSIESHNIDKVGEDNKLSNEAGTSVPKKKKRSRVGVAVGGGIMVGIAILAGSAFVFSKKRKVKTNVNLQWTQPL